MHTEGSEARALLAEEAARAHAPGHDPSDACANCRTPLTGPYCAVCGQHGHVHRTAGALLHDLAHGVFHFEGRFWATLPLLALRPGELTRRYAQGERTRFVSPIALFLFSVFVMFAVLGSLPGFKFGDGGLFAAGGLEKAATEVAAERLKTEEAIVEARRRLAAERADAHPDAGEVAERTRTLAAAIKLRDDLGRAQAVLGAPDEKTVSADDKGEDGWLERKLRHARENPQLLLYKIKTSAYKFSWALIPLSVPFIWLLFPLRRDVGLYDHAVFATYSLSFMSLFAVLIAVAAAGFAAAGWAMVLPVLAATLVPPIHIYRQLKGAYVLRRPAALWRTAWLVTFILVIMPLFATLLLYLGADG